MATKKSGKRAKPMAKKAMKKTKGGAWYAKFDGVDGSAESRPTESLSLNYTKVSL